MSRLISGFLFLLLLSAACSQELPTRVPTRKPLLLTPPPTPEVMKEDITAPPVATATATPLPTPVPVENPDFYLLAEPGVPSEIIAAAGQMTLLDPQRYSWNPEAKNADNAITFTVNDGAPLAQ